MGRGAPLRTGSRRTTGGSPPREAPASSPRSAADVLPPVVQSVLDWHTARCSAGRRFRPRVLGRSPQTHGQARRRFALATLEAARPTLALQPPFLSGRYP